MPAPLLNPKQARYAVLAVFFCGTSIELFAPNAGLLVLNILSSFFIFLWYCRERDGAGRRRSLARNLGVILLPFIAIPIYLTRGLPFRDKVRALARFAGFVVLMVLAALAGALVTATLAGLFGMEYAPVI